MKELLLGMAVGIVGAIGVVLSITALIDSMEPIRTSILVHIVIAIGTGLCVWMLIYLTMGLINYEK